MRQLVDRACDWYCNWFGTETAFAISLILLFAWTVLIPVLGWAHWNSTAGLFGNTLESTGEWFFEIAILVVARRVDQRQRAQQEHMAQQIEHMERILDHLGVDDRSVR